MLDLMNIGKKHLISLFEIDNASKGFKYNNIFLALVGSENKPANLEFEILIISLY